MAREKVKPFIRARASRGTRDRGSRPYIRWATMEGTSLPSFRNTHPSPMRARATWALGDRSPLAPTDPLSGTFGVIPRFRKWAILDTRSGLTPDIPFKRCLIRRNMAART